MRDCTRFIRKQGQSTKFFGRLFIRCNIFERENLLERKVIREELLDCKIRLNVSFLVPIKVLFYIVEGMVPAFPIVPNLVPS